MLDTIDGTTGAAGVRPGARRDAGGEDLFHRLLETLPAGAYTCDTDGLITYYNRRAVELWGRIPALGDPVDRYCGSFRLYTADGAPLVHADCWMALALRDGRAYLGEEIIIERPDGQRLTVLAHASPVFDDAGAVSGAVNVLIDISDRKRNEIALRSADRAKNEFLATMSHEIRTPINAILGYADLLDVEVAGPLTPAQRTQLGRIQASGRHLLTLVTEVLDLAKIEAGQMRVRRESHRVAEAADAALAVIQPLASARGITLVNRCLVDESLAYDGDEDRVRQVLLNLLSNAIKFSEPGSRVELSCEERSTPLLGVGDDARTRWVGYRVRDWGIGIPAHQLEHIFEPFVQVEARTTRTRGGTGLGLTITRRLARLMGGDLAVESAVGSGSVFTLWMPCAEAPIAAEPFTPGRGVPAVGSRALGFRAAGHALLGSLNDILHRYVARLRAEDIGPGARTLSDAQLGDHAATLVSEIAIMLIALEDDDRVSPTFIAGSDIQRACAIEHGRQRAYLGWSESDLDRGFDALGQAIADRLRQHPSAAEPDHGQVLITIRRCIERAKTYGASGMRSVRAAG